MINRRFLCLAAALALVAGCATQPVPVSVADTLAQTPSLSTLHLSLIHISEPTRPY